MSSRKQPPADEDVLYLDVDQTGKDESLDDILKQAQESAERRAERRAVEAATPGAAGGGEEIVEETVIEEIDTSELTRRIADIEGENQKLRGLVDELKDALQRKQADYENFRKRMQRDKEDFQKYANSNLLKESLPVLDNLERALMVGPDAGADALRQGVDLVLKQLKDALARFGLQDVVAIGQEFDPNYHEAVASEVSSDLPPNTVMAELQKGYVYHDRLLRPAFVKVAMAAPESGGSTTAGADGGADGADGAADDTSSKANGDE